MPTDHSEFTFDLDAGRLCLDFVNTLSASSGEHLNSYADLVAFARQSGLLTPEDAHWLRSEAERDARGAERVYRRALVLRAALRDLFFALAAGGQPRERDLAALNSEIANCLAHARVVPDDARDGGYRWGWRDARTLDAPLWPISRSAADLLTDPAERALVRQCSSATCEWVFLDTSKNRTRQWCSMQSCGNREKARRHYERVKAARGATELTPRRALRTAATRAGGASATAE